MNNISEELNFGWELLYNNIQNNVNKKSDVIIALTHFLLLKKKFRCLGLGESKSLAEGEKGSEVLPNGWSDDNKYTMRYVYNNGVYLLMGVNIEDSFILNLLSVSADKVSNITLLPESLVQRLHGPLQEIMPDNVLLATRLNNELIDPVFPGISKEISTQTDIGNEHQNTRNPLQIGEPRRPAYLRPMPAGPIGRPFGFPDVGRSDLDPFGGFGSGNLLTFPSRPSGIGIPRYDPVNPVDPNIPQRLNRDHFRPPTFGDFDGFI